MSDSDSASQPAIRQRQIVWANLSISTGQVKRRPAIVVTATEEIVLDAPFVVLPVTTTFADPAPANCFELPWNARGWASTGLRKRSAAVLDAPQAVRSSDVLSVAGYLPTKPLLDLIERMKRMNEDTA